MKSTYIKIMAIAIIAFFSSCNDDNELTNTNVSSVETLYAPEDNKFYNLGAQSSAVFEWQHAKAEDNGVVLYDIAFDLESGDFSNPIYVTPSDGKGFQNVLNLSFTELNKIAERAGIQAKNIGKLKWTVFSSKGFNLKQSNISRTIEVERPAGFPTPDELFITGDASEYGDDIENAFPLKKTGATTYEIYTSLKPGDYSFVTRKEGTPEVYFINGANLETDSSTTYSDTEKVFKIMVDFSDASVKIIEVEKIELWFPPLGQYLYDFNYIGNGTWRAANVLIEFKQESWGRDERYKFKFTVNDEGTSIEKWFGSTNGDNQRPNDSTGLEYWYMVPVTDDYWSNSFKFDGNVDEANANIDIIFSSTANEYTHLITKL
tara:strand:+ start:44323 stop:45447 length:1125 start_codon:yes stop_codon:yes gene_type:complete